MLAQKTGLRIHEVPVDWVDDPDSSVNIVATATADLKGIARLPRATFTGEIPMSGLREPLGRAPIQVRTPGLTPSLVRQLVRFATVGVASTVAYLVLFLLLVTAVGNTALNRRLTFGIRGREGAGPHQFQGLIVVGLGLALTSGALAWVHAMTAPGLPLQITALVLANLAATVLRFLLLRGRVFRSRRQPASERES